MEDATLLTTEGCALARLDPRALGLVALVGQRVQQRAHVVLRSKAAL